jgi:glycerate-2-kinase
MLNWRIDVEEMYRAALEACEPYRLVKGYLDRHDLEGYGGVYVTGWGKCSARMALGAEAVLGDRVTEGLVLGLEDRSGRIDVRSVPHPYADSRTVELTENVEELVGKVGEDDVLVCLVSGGGSAMLCDPVVPVHNLNASIKTMMEAGADIGELNAFRRSVSNVKGGRLGGLCKGHILNLIISDVIGNSLFDIASGPTVEDTSGLSGRTVAEKYGLNEEILDALDDTRPSIENESHILADNSTAVRAAAEHGASLGLDIEVRNKPYTGEASDVAMQLLSEAPEGAYYIAGGEATVKVTNPDGVGGRSQHLCLSLHDHPCYCFSAGTDGVDGNSTAAGAYLDENSRASDWKDFLERFDSASFFARSNSQLKTGPTGTNVCDITIIKKH